MNKLVIDTATNLLYVGLLKDGKTFTKTRIGKNDNAAYVVNFVKELLEEQNLTIDNIDEIITGVGPGSYTGIRVSVVVSKTLAYSKNIKLKQISSLKLLSSGHSEAFALIDARRGSYFGLKHKLGETLIDDHYLKLDSLENYLLLEPKNIKVDLEVVSKEATTVEDVFMLEPNYLRKTEAETNYDKSNDLK